MIINNKEYQDYLGFKCLQITNGTIKCLITVDVGPRIIYYGFDKNILFVDKTREIYKDGEFFDKNYKPGERWNIYGGHRLWKSEEDLYTYNCDNYPVKVQHTTAGANFISSIQKCTSLLFELEVNMNKNGSLKVTHKITNKGTDTKNIAAWGITILTAGGLEILPMSNEKTGFLPNRTISVWEYTDLSDKRISFTGKYLKVKQRADNKSPLKIGIKNTDGFGFYVVDDLVFIKKTNYEHGKLYPDANCNYETYTSDKIIEMETLSPFKSLEPGSTLTYEENWNIKKINGQINLETEKEIDEFVEQYII